ncbi:MAG: MFS transporter [Filimonas sp.]|nr:MFS transporter [Filimonas sp.]
MGTTVKRGEWKMLFEGENAVKAIALALGVALHATNIYLSTTILPSVVKEIGGLEWYAWNTTVFVITSIIGAVISAFFLAHSGPKVTYRSAIIVFVIGALICMQAPSMTVMLIGRAIQGFGGGLLFALSYAMVRIIFTENLWARAMALVSSMWGVAAFSGPFIGGIFAEFNQWRLAFATIGLLCLPLLWMTERTLPGKEKSVNAPVMQVPYTRLFLLALAAIAVSTGSLLSRIEYSISTLVLAILLFVLTLLLDKKSTNKLLPSGTYRKASMLKIYFLVMGLLTIATTVEIYVPYFSQMLFNFSPLRAGYFTVLIAVGWTACSVLFSGAGRSKLSLVVTCGTVMMLAGLILLVFMSSVAYTPITVTLIGLALVMTGGGIGICWPHLITAVFLQAEQGEEEITSSSVTTIQLIATAFGAALAGLVTHIAGIANGAEGVRHAAIVLYGCFAAAPLLALIIWKKGKK